MYVSAVMSILYLARMCRPDLLLTVSVLATKCKNPIVSDFIKLERLLNFIRHTMTDTMVISCQSFHVNVYCDSSYASHSSGHSQSGYIFTLGDNKSFLHSVSRKQTQVATSSTEAEIIAAAEAIKDLVFIIEIMYQLVPKTMVKIIFYQDNESAIHLFQSPSKARNSKHLLTKLMFVFEMIKSYKIDLQYISTSDMIADINNKHITTQKFKMHQYSLMQK